MYNGPDWSKRKEGQPFFAQIHLPGGKHRSSTMEGNEKFRERIQKDLRSVTNLSKVKLPPYYPNDPVLVDDWAAYLDSVRLTDKFMGDIIQRLKDEGDYENTIVLFMTDHGISHARGKQFLYDEGLHVPLIITGPGIEAGDQRDDLVEHIDIAALSLGLAGIEIPKKMQAKDILADDYKKRNTIYAARDRCDETVEYMRGLRTQRYKYIRNYLYQRPHLQPNRYKDKKDIIIALRAAHKAGSLNDAQEMIFNTPRPKEELYDLKNDPHEINNLANNPKYKKQLDRFSKRLDTWIKRTGDKGPETEARYDSDMAVYMNSKSSDPGANETLVRNIAIMKRWAAEGK